MIVRMHLSNAARCNLSYILTAQRNPRQKTLHTAGGEKAWRAWVRGRSGPLSPCHPTALGARLWGSARPSPPRAVPGAAPQTLPQNPRLSCSQPRSSPQVQHRSPLAEAQQPASQVSAGLWWTVWPRRSGPTHAPPLREASPPPICSRYTGPRARPRPALPDIQYPVPGQPRPTPSSCVYALCLPTPRPLIMPRPPEVPAPQRCPALSSHEAYVSPPRARPWYTPTPRPLGNAPPIGGSPPYPRSSDPKQPCPARAILLEPRASSSTCRFPGL